MALTSKEQNKLIQLLGYGGKTLQSGSVIFNKILTDRLQNLPIDEESFLREWLSQVYCIENLIKAAPTRLSASGVADIKINNRELEDLRRERKRIARELAVHLDVPYQGVNGASVSMKS